MSETKHRLHGGRGGVAPGDEPADTREIVHGLLGYLVGLSLATGITAVAFFLTRTSLVWQPSIPIALFVLAIAQIGVHLVFFLHITTGPDNVNNVLALAFGVLIVFLLIVGSLWIMTHMNHNMLPMDQIMQMQR
jgi:cytochrome o ubiquinol oxidase subunit IV